MDCGECTECCELLKIDSRKPLKENEIEPIEIFSPAGELCTHCERNVGCKVYEQRPTICRTFKCAYVEHENVSVELRPDKCGVIFEKLDDELMLGTVRPKKTITPIAIEQLNNFNKQGMSVVLVKHDTPGIKVFCNDSDTQRDVMIKFARYRRIADG